MALDAPWPKRLASVPEMPAEEDTGALSWPRPSGESRAEMQEYLAATMAVAAARMEAIARIQREAAAALQSLAAYREQDAVIRQFRRVEEAVSALAEVPVQRKAPPVRPRNARGPDSPGQAGLPSEPLTEQELRVLRYLRGTLTLREIAQELYVSRNSLKSHTKAIYRKLGATGRDDAVRRGRELGISARQPNT